MTLLETEDAELVVLDAGGPGDLVEFPELHAMEGAPKGRVVVTCLAPERTWQLWFGGRGRGGLLGVVGPIVVHDCGRLRIVMGRPARGLDLLLAGSILGRGVVELHHHLLGECDVGECPLPGREGHEAAPRAGVRGGGRADPTEPIKDRLSEVGGVLEGGVQVGEVSGGGLVHG